MKLNILFVSVILITFSLTSCEKSIFCKKGSGDVIAQSRSINNFQEIDLSISGDLILIQSDTLNIIVEAQENLISEIETVVKNNYLTIKTDGCIKTDKPIKIYVYVPELTRISLSGSGNITQEGNWDFTELNLNISGSGNISLENCTISGKLENNITGSGNIVLSNFIASEIINNIVGSGDILISSINNLTTANNTITGSGDISLSSTDTIQTNNVKIIGDGDIHSRDFAAEDVDCRIDGSGNAFVNAINNLNVNITGSGNVYYVGRPLIDVNVTGSGSIINNN